MPKALDELDRQLIRILQRDARTPFTHIASELSEKSEEKVPDTTIHFRTKKLVKNNVVSRFAALVRPEAFGYHIAALFKIEIGGHILPDISKERTTTFADELAEKDHVLWVAIEEPNTIHTILLAEDEESIRDLRDGLSKSPDVVNIVLIPLATMVKGWELSGNPE
ncbi:MAG: Lrp/AsnC family transcriptional regulator [Candidatus Thorarchaeota archaeon]